MFATNFTTLDGVIIVLYLLGTVAIGVVVNRYIHNVAGYMVGGRAAGSALNAATMIGTNLGLVTLMYASIEGFTRGLVYIVVALIAMAISLFLGTTGFAVEKLRALKLTTITEYFERRYDRRVRVVAGAVCAVAGIVNMGLFPKMGAIFLTYVTGLGGEGEDRELVINLVTSALILLVLVYTVLGGMVSVIVTDFLQFLFLSVAMGLGLYFCFSHPDVGWNGMFASLAEQRGEAAFNPVHPASYGWIWIAWQVCLFVAVEIAWAPAAARILTARDPRAAKRTFLLATPGMFVRLGVPVLWAVAALAYFSSQPELAPYFFPDGTQAAPAHAAEAMPLLIGKIVPAGLLGLFVAGLMAAFMSTHDSYFLCWSSVIVRDVVNPLRRRPLSDRGQIRAARVLIVLIGLFLLVWGVWYELPESVWNYMAVTGNIYLCGAGVSIIGGLYWKRASRAGALAALLGGLLSAAGLFAEEIHSALGLSASLQDLRYGIGLGGYVLCAALFAAFSLLFPDREREAAA